MLKKKKKNFHMYMLVLSHKWHFDTLPWCCGFIPSHCIPEPDIGWPFLGLFQIRNRRAELIKNIPNIKTCLLWMLNALCSRSGFFFFSLLGWSLYGSNQSHVHIISFGKHAGLVSLFKRCVYPMPRKKVL